MNYRANKAFFITGTDTGIGKTWCSIALMQALQKKGLVTCGMKPVASGAIRKDGVLVSEDAMLLMDFADIALPYKHVNPVCLESACSPNIAAEIEGRPFTHEKIVLAFDEISKLADSVIVEGIGGWRTPSPDPAGMAEMVRKLQIPVILVVGLRLGCVNHALLTKESIVSDGARLSGWIVNCIDPGYPYVKQTVDYLVSCFDVPLLGQIPYQQAQRPNGLGDYLSLPN